MTVEWLASRVTSPLGTVIDSNGKADVYDAKDYNVSACEASISEPLHDNKAGRHRRWELVLSKEASQLGSHPERRIRPVARFEVLTRLADV